MKKTITLNELQMKLLKEFKDVSDDLVIISKQCKEITENDPFFDSMVIKFNKACARHDSAASVFAASVAATL